MQIPGAMYTDRKQATSNKQQVTETILRGIGEIELYDRFRNI